MAAYLVFAESCRIFPMLAYFLIIPAQLILRCIHTFKGRILGKSPIIRIFSDSFLIYAHLMRMRVTKINQDERTQAFERLYSIFTQIRILMVENVRELQTTTFLLLIVGAFLSASVNFATLRGISLAKGTWLSFSNSFPWL